MATVKFFNRDQVREALAEHLTATNDLADALAEYKSRLGPQRPQSNLNGALKSALADIEKAVDVVSRARRALL